MQSNETENLQEKENIVPGSSKEGDRPHPNRDALDSVDVLEYYSWFVSAPVCGMGTGGTGNHDHGLCAQACCQEHGEARHVSSQDN